MGKIPVARTSTTGGSSAAISRAVTVYTRTAATVKIVLKETMVNVFFI